MEEIYSDIKNPASLASVEKLYKQLKKTNDTVRKKDVEKFLSGKESYTLHRHGRNRFSRRKFMFKSPGHTLMADVAYMKMYEKQNSPFLLVLMDGYSRYLTVYPLESLRASFVVNILDNFFKSNIYKYVKFFSDQGVEFTNKLVNKMYKKHNIHWYTTFSKTIKVSPVERVILTLKNKIKRYISHFNTEKYSNVLIDIVKTYNITQHRMLDNRTPLDVHLLVKWEDIKALSQKLYIHHAKKTKTVGSQLSQGQVVRIQSARHVFSRAIDVRNTYELFKVKTVNESHIPVTYTLQELDGDLIGGIFYREELTPVEDKGLYAVEVLKTRKRKGKTQYQIRYVHFKNCPLKWVEKKMLEKLN